MDDMAVVTIFDCVGDLPEHAPCVHLRHASVQSDVICQQINKCHRVLVIIIFFIVPFQQHYCSWRCTELL